MSAGNRSGVRIPVPPEEEACVEVQLEGRCCRLPLLDISENGLSFECPDGLPEIAPDSSFTDAVVRVADCAIQGNLVIRLGVSSVAGKMKKARLVLREAGRRGTSRAASPPTGSGNVRGSSPINKMFDQKRARLVQAKGGTMRPSRAANRLGGVPVQRI